MKRLILFIILIVPFIVKATSYTSVTGGGNWSNSATWSPAGVPGSGDDVTIASAVTINANESVHSITINSSQTLSGSASVVLSIYGDFTNNGTFTANSNIMKFLGSSNQTITGATTFYTLVINPSASTDTVFLASAITDNDNLTITTGVLDCQTNQITGNTSGKFSMSSGTVLLLGLKTSSVIVLFPTNFYTNNSSIALDPNSTIVYQADTSAQVISIKPPKYGNLDIYTGASSVTKNFSAAGTVTAAGTLTVGDGSSAGTITLGVGANALTLTGTTTTATINTNGAITYSGGGSFTVTNSILITGNGSLTSSGTNYFYFGGNFTNNGSSPTTSFSAGTSWVYFNGTANQVIGGTQTTTFCNLTTYGSSTDTLKLADSITIINQLMVWYNPLDVSKTGNYSVLVETQFVNDAGVTKFIPEKGTIYFGKGTGSIAIGGASASTFYNVVSNPGTGNTVSSLTYNMTVNNNLLDTTGNFSFGNTTVTVGNNVTISNGATLTSSGGTLKIGGTYIDNGTFTYGSGTVNFDGSGSTIQLIKGTATQPLVFYNLTIAGTSPDTVRLRDSIYVVNNFTLNSGSSGVFDVSQNDCEVKCHGAFTNNESSSAFDARKGWVSFYCGGPLGGTYPTIFNNVNLEDCSVGINTSETVLDTLKLIGGAWIGMNSPQILTIGNAYLNYSSSISSGTGLIQFAGNTTAKNYIGGTVPLIIENLKVNLAHATDTLFLYNEGLTVNSHDSIQQGVLNCQTYTLTGSSGTVLDMGGAGTLVLGLKGNGTNSPLPAYSSYNLNPSSTVIYQAANSSQSISSVPTYGNLIISSGSTITKTPSGTPLTIAGNLTVNSSTTLSETTNTINLTGSATINGTLSFSSGTFSIGGNFTNNGTFTYGTSTTTLTGTSGQTIGGSAPTTFYKLTGNSAGSETVTQGYNISVLNNMTISAGTFTFAQANHNLNIGGNFTNSGGTFTANNGLVLMNGASPTLGGSGTISVDTLTIGTSGTTTLGGNVTTASNFTINSGATFSASSYTLTTAGNFTDNGTFNCNTSTIYFDNMGYQCISSVHSSETFKNLTVSMFSKLGTTCPTVDITGTVTVLAGGQMNCYCH
jgi:hypothetical protein